MLSVLLSPQVVPCCVFSEPEDKVARIGLGIRRMKKKGGKRGNLQILGGMLYKEKPFFKVLETERRKVLSIEDIVEFDVEGGDDAPGRDLALCGRGMGQSVLERICEYG